ncbi:DUF3801 domain-containing protein [Lysinibacillus xylanilyticus]|uniref:DUF3801 domain-containing protein n=1 Tax=Lysinibacillus xylanilyticus TaxID=582475 RepID=UPI002E1D036C|nr:DUF3801 domain-containing protein [Lysinibacillus xylanilyticus]
MVSVDEHTQASIEILSQGVKLSEQLILKVLGTLIEMLGKNKEEQNFVIDNNTKEGKQKITDLLNKHKDGVVALDENITKQQLNDYQKELKKMGVDFSVVKTGKDNYSFFFAAEQANIIEKALKNVLESKSNVLENEQVKNLQLDVNNLKEELPNEKVKEVKELYDQTASPEKVDKINTINEKLNNLSSQEKLLFTKLQELDDVKRTLYAEEIKRVEVLFNNQYGNKEITINVDETSKDDSQKDSILIEVDNNLSPEQRMDNIFNQLTPKEQDLFMKINDAEVESLNNAFADKPINEHANNLRNLKENFSEAEIEKVRDLYNKNISTARIAPEGRLHADKVSAAVNTLSKNKQTEQQKSSAVFSIKGVKEIDAKIKSEQKDKDQVKTRKPSLER